MKITALNPAGGPQITNFICTLDRQWKCLLLSGGLPLSSGNSGNIGIITVSYINMDPSAQVMSLCKVDRF